MTGRGLGCRGGAAPKAVCAGGSGQSPEVTCDGGWGPGEGTRCVRSPPGGFLTEPPDKGWEERRGPAQLCV